jgi:hypothetical protein
MTGFELTSEFFEGAAEHLDTHGWWRGSALGPKGQVCALGAIARMEWTVKYRPDMLAFMECYEEICDLMDIPLVEIGNSIVQWNDHHATSQEEVRERLMRAAKKLRDQGR